MLIFWGGGAVSSVFLDFGLLWGLITEVALHTYCNEQINCTSDSGHVQYNCYAVKQLLAQIISE